MILLELCLTVIFILNSIVLFGLLRKTVRKDALELHPVDMPDEMPESVSIVVPMRNEELNVDRCLIGLRAQWRPGVEVIVVDDCSTDRTPERLAAWKETWPELEIIRLNEGEERWAGKGYALHRAVQVAAGESFVFIDADVVLAPGAISRIVATARQRSWPVVSIIGRLESTALWEKSVASCLLAWFVFFRLMRPERVLLGAFIYIRRSLYERVGGFGRLRATIQEDTALARALGNYGVQARTFVWPAAYALRMYSSWRQAFHGMTRSFIADYRIKPASRNAIVVGFAAILPVVCMIVLLVTSPLHDLWTIALLLSATVATVMQFVFYAQVLVRLGISSAMLLTKPLGDLVLFIAALNATLKAMTGGTVDWRGREFSKRLVSAGHGTSLTVRRADPETIPGHVELSVVITVTSDSDAGQIGGLMEIAERSPDAEFVVVTNSGIDAGASTARNVSIITASDTNAFGLHRRGFLSSRGNVVAFASPRGEYCPNWIDSILKAFESRSSQIVVGNTQYDGDAELSFAGWIRDWAEQRGLSTPVPRMAACNFGARREILERYEFGHDLHGRGAAVLFATQAAMDGVEVTYAPEMTCKLPNPYADRDTAIRHLRREHELAREIYDRGVAVMDSVPFGSQLFARFLPLAIATRLGKLTRKNCDRLCDELGLKAGQRSQVQRHLKKLGLLDLKVAVQDVAAPPRQVNEFSGDAPRKAAERDLESPTRGVFRVLVFYAREYKRDR